MPAIRLRQIPDKTPVKVTLALPPDLFQQLVEYAGLYEETYGRAETISDLVPAMLAAFLEADRSFANRLKGRAK